jgi:hypothetical protein
MMPARYPFAPLRKVTPAMLSNAAFKAGCHAMPPRDEKSDQAYQVMVDMEQRLTQDFEAVAS